jgi:hypothetical protein
MSHWLTNRGKTLLMGGLWDDAGASAVKVGFLTGASIPTAADTEAEIQDLDTVAALLALSGVTEGTGALATRQSLSRTNATEDDTNNRANLDAANVTVSSVAAGQTVQGFFWYDATTDTNDTTRILCGVGWFASPVPTNGSDFTLTINDFIRAT